MKAKTEVYQIRFTTEEKELIEQHAKKEGFTVADYIRIAVLFDMILSGEVRALKIVSRNLAEKITEKLRARWAQVAGKAALD